MPAEHLDGRHHLVVGHRLGRHEELQLVDARGLVNGDAPKAGLGIAGHEDAAVDEGVGVDLVPQRGRDLPGAAGQIHLGRAVGAFRLEIAREVRLEMLGHAAPRIDELLVQVRLVLQVRAIRPEEGPERFRRQLARRLVVGVAEAHRRGQPLVVDDLAHRGRVAHALLVRLDVRLEVGRRGHAQRHHPDALLRRELIRGGLERRHPHPRVRLLVGLRAHVARRHVPELALPREEAVLPDLRDHRQRLFPHRARVARVDAHADLLVRRRPAGAELDPAPRQVIDHRHALGHAHGMVVGKNHHAESEADALGPLAQRAEDHLRARGHREARQEVVLDEPDGIEAHLVREHALLDRLLDRPRGHRPRAAASRTPGSISCAGLP